LKQAAADLDQPILEKGGNLKMSGAVKQKVRKSSMKGRHTNYLFFLNISAAAPPQKAVPRIFSKIAPGWG
jgi:hypothetical protein